MKRSYFALVCAVSFCFIALISSGVFAQEIDPAASILKLKKLPTIGFKKALVQPHMVATGNKSLTLFCGDNDSKTRRTDFKVMGLKSRGKVTTNGEKVKKGLFGDEGYSASAHWVGDYSTGHGIVFLLYLLDDAGKSFKLDVAMFNSKGELTGDFENILKIKAAKNEVVLPGRLNAAGNGAKIGVAFDMRSINKVNSSETSKAYFLETDLDGVVTASKREITVPNGGILRNAQVHPPVWNGQIWLVPLQVSKNQKTGGFGTVRSGAIVMVAPVLGSSGKIKPNTIFDLTSKPDYIYQIGILPTGPEITSAKSSPAKASNLYMIYQLKKSDFSGVLMRYSYVYYLQKLNKKGKNSGGRKELKMPVWNKKMTIQAGFNYSNEEKMSAARNIGNGKVAMALTRTVEKYSNTSRAYEHEVALVNINPVSGAVTLVAKAPLFIPGQFAIPSVEIVKGKIAILASMWLKGATGWPSGTAYYYALK